MAHRPIYAYAVILVASLALAQSHVNTGAITVTNPGVFTGSQYNPYALVQIGGINNSQEFNTVQGGTWATDAFSAGLFMPSAANKHQFNVIGAYGVCDVVSSPLSANNNCVALYSQIRMTRSGGSGWSSNPVIVDSVGMTGHAMYVVEGDVNVNGAPSTLIPYISTGILTATSTIPSARPRNSWCGPAIGGCSALVTFAHVLNNNSFPVGIEFEPGEVNGDAFRFAPSCQSGTCSSATAAFTGFSTGTTSHTALINADSSGNLIFTPAAGTNAFVGSNIITTTLASGHATSGLTAAARSSGCTTGASVGNPCASAVTMTWSGSGYADTSYTVSCTGTGPVGIPGPIYAITKSNATMTVNFQNLSGGGTSAWSSIDCQAIHD